MLGTTTDPAAPSWDNFMQPLDDANERLARAWGQVGHLNMGAGRVVYQELTRINLAIADGTFGVTRRPPDGGRGLDGVIERADRYFNPVSDLLGTDAQADPLSEILGGDAE